MFRVFAKLIRFLSVWTFVLASLPVFWAIVFIRPVNYLLRYLNVPNSKMPLDLAQKFWCYCVVHLAGITVTVEGKENLAQDKRHQLEKNYVILPNHLTGLDPWIVGNYFPGMFPKMTFKKELMYTLAPVFVLGRLLGHISIDRSNHENAMKAMEDAGKKISKFHRSVTIFPEGTRSKNGQLQPFKKGGFHVAKSAKIPIAPLVLSGVHELWPSGFFPDPGMIT